MEHQPISNIHNSKELTIGQAVDVLSKEFPDVTISSLRFLEREGLLTPHRKPGGHRVYSPHDLYRARRIKQLQAERKSLKEIRELLKRAASITDLNTVVEDVTSHLLGGSIPDALVRLYDLIDSGIPLINICNDVLTPVLLNLGDDEGNHLIPVDMQFELDEHLVRFLAAATVPTTDAAGRPVILACSPIWERHDMPVRMYAALLEESGAAVHFLGSLVDRGFMLDAMERVKPDVILVSMTVTPGPKIVSEWFDAVIGAMTPHQRLLIGGMGAGAAAAHEAENVRLVGTAGYPEIIEKVIGLGR